jgi:hypothetical protein
MRRALALAAVTALSTAALATAGAAYAEHWTKFANGDNGTEWSYDGDYSYKDKQTGRLVVMQAISKPSANIAPAGPGAGVGYLYALDCAKHNLIMISSYKPSQPFAIPDNWRSNTPKKAGGAEDEALFSAVCPHVDHVPVK